MDELRRRRRRVALCLDEVAPALPRDVACLIASYDPGPCFVTSPIPTYDQQWQWWSRHSHSRLVDDWHVHTIGPVAPRGHRDSSGDVPANDVRPGITKECVTVAGPFPTTPFWCVGREKHYDPTMSIGSIAVGIPSLGLFTTLRLDHSASLHSVSLQSVADAQLLEYLRSLEHYDVVHLVGHHRASGHHVSVSDRDAFGLLSVAPVSKPRRSRKGCVRFVKQISIILPTIHPSEHVQDHVGAMFSGTFDAQVPFIGPKTLISPPLPHLDDSWLSAFTRWKI